MSGETATLSGWSPTVIRGFTLLELLVVLLIIGIIASVVSLNFGDGQVRELERETARLEALFELARRDAVFMGEEYALHLYRGGYGFLRFDEEQQDWLPVLTDPLLRLRELPDFLQPELMLEGQQVALDTVLRDEAAAPQILFLSSGEMTPFLLRLRLDGERFAELRGHPLGRIEVALQ